jgi:acyl carrier protein
MGLDYLELILETEESFGVRLRDEDLAKAVTPQALGDLVYEQLEKTNEELCQSQKAFYILRNALMKKYGLKRNGITPEYNLSGIIPAENQKEHWLKIKELVKARRWPKLLLPPWLSILGIVTSIIIVTILPVLVIMLLPFWPAWLGFFGGVGIAVLFWKAFGKITFRFRQNIPDKYRVLRELVKFVKTSDHMKWTRDQVQKQLKEIIMRKFGIKESQYNDDGRFKEDLGLSY